MASSFSGAGCFAFLCDIADVGGLTNLKRWLQERTGAFTAEARAYGLPEPKGLLLPSQGSGQV
jgi:hypothetical protein